MAQGKRVLTKVTMKHSIVFYLLLLIESVGFAQTDSIEKVRLYDKVIANELTSIEFNKLALKWKQTITDTNAYPQLPFDKQGEVHYSYIIDYKNVTQKALFNRLLEWLSISYGIFPAYLYSNPDDGKIIYRNSFNTTTGYTCIYTGIMTLKEGAMMVEFLNMTYQLFIPGHYSNDTWVPDNTIEFGFKEIFPIILKKPTEWNTNLNLLRFTDNYFETTTDTLCNFIETYDQLYDF
jgi:hypothetical protein